MSLLTRYKFQVRVFCRDALAIAHLKFLSNDSRGAERTRAQLYGSNVEDAIVAFIDGIPLERTDQEILRHLLQYLDGREEKARTHEAISTQDLPRAVDFVHKLLDNSKLWTRVTKVYYGATWDRLCTLALHLVRRCNIPPTTLYVVSANVPKVPHRLGSGADIYTGALDNRKVCVKRLRYTLNMPLDEKLEVEDMFYREAAIWSQLRHPNVLPLLGIDRVNFPTMPCMVSPWIQNGGLLQYRKTLPQPPLASQLNKWVLDVSKGLAYLHEYSVTHGDVRSDNIMVSSDGSTAQIGDIGLTTFTRTYAREYYTWRDNSERWDAPELMEPNMIAPNPARPSFATDVYSFGLVCVEIYSGEMPFADLKMLHVRPAVLRGERPPRPTRPAMSDHLWSEIQLCWSQGPEHRPAIGDVQRRLSKILKG